MNVLSYFVVVAAAAIDIIDLVQHHNIHTPGVSEELQNIKLISPTTIRGKTKSDDNISTFFHTIIE